MPQLLVKRRLSSALDGTRMFSVRNETGQEPLLPSSHPGLLGCSSWLSGELRELLAEDSPPQAATGMKCLTSYADPGQCQLPPPHPLAHLLQLVTAAPYVEPPLGQGWLFCYAALLIFKTILLASGSSLIHRACLWNCLYRWALIWLFGIICIEAGQARGLGSASPTRVSCCYTEASALATWGLGLPQAESRSGQRGRWLACRLPVPTVQLSLSRSGSVGRQTFLLGLPPPALLQIQLADQPPALLQELIVDVGGVGGPWSWGPVGRARLQGSAELPEGGCLWEGGPLLAQDGLGGLLELSQEGPRPRREGLVLQAPSLSWWRRRWLVLVQGGGLTLPWPLLCFLRAEDPLHLHQRHGCLAAGLKCSRMTVHRVALGPPRLQGVVHQGHGVPEGRGCSMELGLG